MTEPLTPNAALLLRRILVSEDSRLPLVHNGTEAMTALTDELKERGLVTTVMGTLAPLPPVPQSQRQGASRAARALLTEGIENSVARTWLTSLGVPIAAPSTPRADDAWMTRIYALPQRRITVEDVLRTAPDAGMRGGATPADEVLHWLDAMVSAKQLILGDDGSYEFPLPTAEALDAALVDLRAGNFVPPRTATELVMRGDAVIGADGAVVPASVSERKTEDETSDTLAECILELVAARGRVDFADVAQALSIDVPEARAALVHLDDAGRLEKVKGSLSWRLPAAPAGTVTKTARTLAGASGTPAPKTAPSTPQANGTVAPATGTGAKTTTTPKVSQPETTKSVTTIGETILDEVRELRRDVRQALAPVTAPKVDAQSAEELLAASDPMTKKVLVRVVVCLQVYGEMTRTALRKTMNGKRASHLPESIALGLRLGVLDANAQGGKALRLIDPSKVITTAELERLAAEQRERDGDEEDNGLLGGLAHAARTLTGAVS